MAWIAWLVAPLAVTTAGALWYWLRGIKEARSAQLRPGNAIAEHHELLSALCRGRENEELPVNLVLLSPPIAQGELLGR
jgi:hypothetical protein